MLNNISYSDFTQFLLKSLETWKNRFHTWSERENLVYEELYFCVRIMTQIEKDIPSLRKKLEEDYGLVVPFIWGAYSDIYFKNWSILCKKWNLLCERPLH